VSTSDFAARLTAELKRTRIAVRNEIQGITVDEVVICGVGPHFESLAKQVSVSLDIPVKTFDPWQGISRGSELRAKSKTQPSENLPEKPERFASLIGAILQGVKNESSSIDFCNSKKRRESAGHRQLITSVLAAVLFVFVCLVGFGLYSRMALTSEIQTLTAQRNALKKTAGAVIEQRNQLNAIDVWLADNVDWFEQLDWLSRKMPGAQEMILTELTFSANNGGSMNLRSLLKDFSVVSPMEEQLRDEKHVIKPGEKGEQAGNKQYSFRYDLSIFLSKESAAAAKEAPPEEQPTEPMTTPEE
jgi:Tfp pilus assembly protein PilN